MTEQELADLIDREAEAIAQDIVSEWRFIGQTEVWHSLPPEMTFDDLPNVLRAISRAALAPRFERDACRQILHYSSLHGDHRHTEGFQEGYIYAEYHLLRRSLWQFMRTRLDADAAISAISRIDAAISLATMAGLRGFHCQTFTARGDWPAALNRLLDEWPLVGS
jgi:hypothetical protein